MTAFSDAWKAQVVASYGAAPSVTYFDVPLVLTATGGKLQHVKIQLQFAGFSWTVSDKVAHTPVYTDSINVKKYAKYGVGLYKASGVGTGDNFNCTGSALIKVKGKKVPVKIFELIGLKGESPPERLEKARQFEAAFAEFRARRFSQAGELFLSLKQKGDRPSEVYVGLCERYRTDPPPPDWDGSYQMEHK